MIIGTLQKIGKPIVGVCSYGRSGSSYLMKFLESLGVAVVGQLPFEDRTSQAVLIATIRLQFELDTQAQPDTKNHQIFKGNFYRSSIATDTKSIEELDAKYEEFLREATADGRVALAEKFVGTDLLQIFRAFDDRGMFKPIFLVRDPRDIFISVKEFNKKRGFKGFNDNGDETVLFESICNFALWQTRQSGKFGALICYYEDLVHRRSQSLVALLRYLGIPPSTQRLDQVWKDVASIEGAAAHMTSQDADKSIARWQSEEFSNFKEVFDKYKKQITEIGYL